MLCFGKFHVAIKFMDEKGGVSKFPVEIFSKCRKISWRNPLVCISFGNRNISCFRGLCHDFPSKFFCLTVSNHFVEEPFYAVFQKISVSEKVYG